MKIYRAVSSNQINQKFGVENTPADLLPTYLALGLKGHDGYDFSVKCQDYTLPHGGKCEPVYCDLDIQSVVTSIQTSDTLGFGIASRSEDKDGIFEHLWWHFDIIDPAIKVGTVLESGTQLGIAGRTGRATGDHLHRGLRTLAKDTYGNYYKTQLNNGYQGAVDPAPYFTNEFILNVVNKLQSEVGILQKLILLVKSLFNHDNNK